MNIEDMISTRGIEEIVHFTKNVGLVGALYKGCVKSRSRLEQDSELEYTFQPTAAYRKDKRYLDYVNLSLSEINSIFYNTASTKWHANSEHWWCILSFDPEILTHSGVIFTTTNNIYTGVRRASGGTGLASLFENKVTRWSGHEVFRPDSLPSHLPTCEQAEVLYPGELDTGYIKRIYVGELEQADDVKGYLAAAEHDDISVVVDKEKFRGCARFL